MTYSILFEKIQEPNFEGYYYAHIPAFDLTTHGLGVDGARSAALDLLKEWIAVKREHGEPIPPPDDALIGHITEEEIDALQIA